MGPEDEEETRTTEEEDENPRGRGNTQNGPTFPDRKQ